MQLAPILAAERADSPFGRDDRLGLGVAIALHVVLVLVLVLWDTRPAQIPVPDRIAVTVSDNIALESVSPNPMADPAPSVGAELGETQLPAETAQSSQTPREAVEPRPALVPSPSKATTPSPPSSSAPSADRSERRRPDTPSRGSRLGNDFLSGTGGSGSDADQPAQRAGPLTAASLSSAISRQLRPHWTAPQGIDAEKLVTVLSWEMNPDGSLKGRPRVVSQSGVTPANEPQKARHAELAIRAVQLAAPFDLPSEYYDTWKRVGEFRFDRRL